MLVATRNAQRTSLRTSVCRLKNQSVEPQSGCRAFVQRRRTTFALALPLMILAQFGHMFFELRNHFRKGRANASLNVVGLSRRMQRTCRKRQIQGQRKTFLVRYVCERSVQLHKVRRKSLHKTFELLEI